MKRSTNFYIRRTHRYLGIFIGVQFLFWTIGGFYFSWTNIRNIRGDDLVNKADEPLTLSGDLMSPDRAAAQVSDSIGEGGISQITMSSVLGKLYYEISAETEIGPRTFLVDARSGSLRENVLRDEAVQIARAALNQGSELGEVKYLTSDLVGPHDEYRGQPLPAWAVSFRTPKEFVVYVSAERGKIEAVRTRNWRIFDFLWMLHTMDYNGRDDINNYVLRGFSILGLLTVFSGFVLFAVSSPYLRRRIRLRR